MQVGVNGKAAAWDFIDESFPHSEADDWVETLQAVGTLSCVFTSQSKAKQSATT